MLKFPDPSEHSSENPNITTPTKQLTSSIIHEITNISPKSATPTKSILSSGIKKRKASTPHPNFAKSLDQEDQSPTNESSLTSSSKFISMSETKNRVLTSSLRVSKAHSVTKSVKFKSTRFTREISNENYFDREEAEADFVEEQTETMPIVDQSRKKLEFFEEEEEKDQDEPMEAMDQSDSEAKQKETEQHSPAKCQKLDHSIQPISNVILNDLSLNIPILSKTEEIRRSIIEKIMSSGRKSTPESNQSLMEDEDCPKLALDESEVANNSKISVNHEVIEAQVEAELEAETEADVQAPTSSKSSISITPLVKCSTVKEFEAPNPEFKLNSTGLSPIKTKTDELIDTLNETSNKNMDETKDVLNKEILVEFTLAKEDNPEPVPAAVEMQNIQDENALLHKINNRKSIRMSGLDFCEDHRATPVLNLEEKIQEPKLVEEEPFQTEPMEFNEEMQTETETEPVQLVEMEKVEQKEENKEEIEEEIKEQE